MEIFYIRSGGKISLMVLYNRYVLKTKTHFNFNFMKYMLSNVFFLYAQNRNCWTCKDRCSRMSHRTKSSFPIAPEATSSVPVTEAHSPRLDSEREFENHYMYIIF